MKPGDLVVVKPFPDYYPSFLTKSEMLVGKSGVIVKEAPAYYEESSETWIVLIDNKFLEFGEEELELKNDK